MGKLFSARTRASFELPMVPAVIIGSAITAIFYALLVYGPIDNAILKRYCLCHAVAEASVWMFFIASVGMAMKIKSAMTQHRLTRLVGATLDKYVVEGQDVPRRERAAWLEAHWLSLPDNYRTSWVGKRLAEIIQRQIKRGKVHQLETDIRDLAESESDAQHESFSIVRIVSWAMPMLGFLGTVVGISDTLGQLDTELLASQSQEALKQMTSGLFVAFDTTAIALVLTIVAIFIQFSVSRYELGVLALMDEVVRDNLIEFLGSDARQVEQDLLSPVRQMADDLVGAVRQLVEQQAALWTQSIHEAQKQWSTWTSASADLLRVTLCESLDKSLSTHAQQIEKIEQDSGRQVDARWQQWQITLSDQARVMHAQQKELVRQTESIERLVASTCDLRKVEDAVRDGFSSADMINQLRQATLGIGEAVAVLACSLERAGIIRGVPLKPRAARKADGSTSGLGIVRPDEDPATNTDTTDVSRSAVSPGEPANASDSKQSKRKSA